MMESEWDACADPLPMLDFLRRTESDRKLRLYACADCRRVCFWFDTDVVSRHNIEVAERFADGKASAAELGAANQALVTEGWLGQLKTVTALYLSGTILTDACIPHLAAIPLLRELVLSGTAITDAGLVGLAAARGLHFLQLYDTKVTDAGAARLKQSLPRLNIER